MGSHPKKFPLRMTALLQDAMSLEPMRDQRNSTNSIKDSPKIIKEKKSA